MSERQRVWSIGFEHDGIQIQKSVTPQSDGIGVIFEISSDRDQSTAFVITDRLPNAAGGLSVEDDNWVVYESSLEYHSVIHPDSEVQTGYNIGVTTVDPDRFRSKPIVETSTPADPSDMPGADGTEVRRSTDGGAAPAPRSITDLDTDLIPAKGPSIAAGESPDGATAAAAYAETGVLVGIPAYNEAATIGSVVSAARNYADEVLVVDDGSTDETMAVAESAGATVVNLGSNHGKGTALKTIFERAKADEWPCLVVLDGDWQHNPLEIPRLVEKLTAAESNIVIGSRYIDGDRTDTPFYRRVGQRTLDFLTMSESGQRITDSQSGFRAFDRTAIESIEIRETGFGVESEILSTAADQGLTIEEVPISVRYDVPSPSTSNSVWHGVSVVDSILTIVRDRHPLLFFGLPGAILMVVGITYGGWTVELYQTGGQFYVGKALFSAVTFLVGLFSVYSALIMNMIGNKLERFR